MQHFAVGETREVLTRETIMQLRQRFIGGRQRHFHILIAKQQRVARCVKTQRRLEQLPIGLQVFRRQALKADFQRLQRRSGEPAAECQATCQGPFRTLPSRRQAVAEYGQAQPIALCTGLEIQIGALGDDPLVTHQPGEAFLEIVAGHQRITDHVQCSRPRLARHVQANRGIAGNRHRALPQARHVVLSKACVGVVQGGIVQMQLNEQLAAIDPGGFQGLDDTQRPARGSGAFGHGVSCSSVGGAAAPKATKLALIVTDTQG